MHQSRQPFHCLVVDIEVNARIFVGYASHGLAEMVVGSSGPSVAVVEQWLNAHSLPDSFNSGNRAAIDTIGAITALDSHHVS